MHRRRRGVAALVLVLLTALTVGLSSWWLTSGRFVAAPDVLNQPQDEAVQIARSAGLTIVFQNGYSETVPKGLVISTDPAAGDRIARNGSLHAILSLGPERYPVPKLIGLTKADAQTALQQAHLAVGEISEDYDESSPVGVVIRAGNDPGALLKKASPVDLVLSKGPAPVQVTDFTGKPAAAAADALRSAGFSVTVGQQNSTTVPAGAVISQEPNSGSAPKGSTITLVESSGPPLAQVPEVRGKNPQAASDVLTGAGFTVQVVYLTDAKMRMNLVIGSVPDNTGQAPVGSTITVYVL